jgi:hypothetical protein
MAMRFQRRTCNTHWTRAALVGGLVTPTGANGLRTLQQRLRTRKNVPHKAGDKIVQNRRDRVRWRPLPLENRNGPYWRRAVISCLDQMEGQSMRKLVSLLAAYLVWLCKAFQVTPQSITKDRRGNMPPPSGGIASY